MVRNRRIWWATVALVLLVVSSCASTAPARDPDAPTFAELAAVALADLPGVVSVELTQTPLTDQEDPDPRDAALWEITLAVTVSEQASVDEVVATADAAADFSKKYATDGPWLAGVAVENIDHEPDDDMPSQSPASFEVYPNVRVSAGEDAREIMELLATPGVESIAIAQGFPFVTVTAATDLAAARGNAIGLVLWRDGGSVWAEDGRVRLMDVPERLTDDGMKLIIATSIAYPTAQFWLEALREGPRWPRLYIDKVTTEDASGITAALTDPTMPAAMVNEYELEFVIRVNAADGTVVDSGGVVGRAS